MSTHLILVVSLFLFAAGCSAFIAARAWAEYRDTRDGDS